MWYYSHTHLITHLRPRLDDQSGISIVVLMLDIEIQIRPSYWDETNIIIISASSSVLPTFVGLTQVMLQTSYHLNYWPK